jgi:hypothetical protein
LAEDAPGEPRRQIERGYHLAYARQPEAAEVEQAQAFVAEHGLAAFCRVIFNSNEFLYVD